MASFDKETMDFPCPGCKKEIEATYYDIYSRREAKCKRCGSSYKFSSSTASNLKSALTNLESAQKKLSDSMSKLLKDAELVIKKK
ncbi:MAG: hypothetical protein H6627_04570 [Calditrichae bacterium]|nr:hypothetical protein [Calditrichia bacterium]